MMLGSPWLEGPFDDELKEGVPGPGPVPVSGSTSTGEEEEG